MKSLKFTLCVASFLTLTPVALPLASPAWAQDALSTPDAISLRNQILQLQAQVNALQTAQNGGSSGDSSSSLPPPQASGAPAQATAPASSGLIANMVTQISTLQDQVRNLTGQVQDLQNQLQQQNQTFAKQISDINFQLQGGASAPGSAPASGAPAGGAPAGATGSTAAAQPNAPTSLNQGTANLPTGTLGTLSANAVPAAAPEATPAAAPAPTSQDILQHGIEALGKRDYSVAAKDAKTVLTADHASALGYDAQFLLARAMAGKHDWQNAAIAYDDTYRRAKFGSHSQEAQLGEATALMELGDNGAACGALNRLTKQYPSPHTDIAASIAKTKARTCAR